MVQGNQQSWIFSIILPNAVEDWAKLMAMTQIKESRIIYSKLEFVHRLIVYGKTWHHMSIYLFMVGLRDWEVRN